jgi:TonB family protein
LITREIEIEVQLTIDAAGNVTRAEPVTGQGALAAALGVASAEAARMWKFEPSYRGGRAIPSTVNIQFKFGPRQRR